MPRGVASKKTEAHEWSEDTEGKPEWQNQLERHCTKCGTPWVDVPAPQAWQKVDWASKRAAETCAPPADVVD